MTLEELQARLAKDLGPKYKGPKRKVNVTFKNLQKAIADDLKEIEEEEKNNYDYAESDFDLDDIDNIDEYKEENNDHIKSERKVLKQRRNQKKNNIER